MNRITLSELEIKANLFPFSQVRHVSDIRVGILTIREKWEHYLGHPIMTDEVPPTEIDDSIIFSANILPSREFVDSCIK
ncbi:MAG: putative sugar nucleotidyl transferase, partial [Flavitalea sp.]